MCEVCLQESLCAAEYRMLRLGLENIDLAKLGQWLHFYTEVREFKWRKAIRLVSLLDRCRDSKLKSAYGALKKSLLRDVKELDTRLELGRYIRRYLLSCPWNTTEAFRDKVLYSFAIKFTWVLLIHE